MKTTTGQRKQRGIIPARSREFSLRIAYEANMTYAYLRGRASIFCQVQKFMHFIGIVLKFIFKCVNKILSAVLGSVCADPKYYKAEHCNTYVKATYKLAFIRVFAPPLPLAYN